MKTILTCLFAIFLLYTLSAQENFQRLDSIRTTDISFPGQDPVPGNKRIYTYDENNLPDLTIISVYNDLWFTWNNLAKVDCDHNAHGDISQMISYLWDNLIGIWERSVKVKQYHDSGHRFVLGEEFNWNDTTYTWVPVSKINNSYNAYDSLTLSILQRWNTLENKFENDIKVDISYGANGKRFLGLSYSWDEGWKENTKEEYEYNDADNLVQKTTFFWSGSSNDWVFRDRIVNSYDNNQNKTKIVDSSWDQLNGIWSNNYQQEYFYNPISQLLDSSIYSGWDSDNSSWLKELKFEMTYDPQNRVEEGIIHLWHAFDELWLPYIKQVLDYPYVVPKNNLYLPYDLEPELFFNQVKINETASVDYYSWDTGLSNWSLSGTLETYYSDIFTSVVDDYLTKTKIYPNPAKDELNIESDYDINGLEFHFYDMNGTLKYKTIGSNRLSIPILSSGGYILRVMDGPERILVKKILVNQ